MNSNKVNVIVHEKDEITNNIRCFENKIKPDHLLNYMEVSMKQVECRRFSVDGNSIRFAICRKGSLFYKFKQYLRWNTLKPMQLNFGRLSI